MHLINPICQMPQLRNAAHWGMSLFALVTDVLPPQDQGRRITPHVTRPGKDQNSKYGLYRMHVVFASSKK